MSITELTAIQTLRTLGKDAQYKVHKTDKFILWNSARDIVNMITFISTEVETNKTSNLRSVFERYMEMKLWTEPLAGPPHIKIVPSITEGEIYNVLQYKIDPVTTRTVGRSWYPKFVINMKLYDEPQIHPTHGKYLAWSTHIIEV